MPVLLPQKRTPLQRYPPPLTVTSPLTVTFLWRCGVVVITTAQLHSRKPELRFSTGSNSALNVSEIRDGEDLCKWSRLEIRLYAFRRSAIPQKQVIIIIIIIIIIIVIPLIPHVLKHFCITLRTCSQPLTYTPNRWDMLVNHCQFLSQIYPTPTLPMVPLLPKCRDLASEALSSHLH